MEHDSSFNTQLRKEVTATTVMNNKNEKLEVDIDEKNLKNM